MIGNKEWTDGGTSGLVVRRSIQAQIGGTMEKNEKFIVISLDSHKGGRYLRGENGRDHKMITNRHG